MSRTSRSPRQFARSLTQRQPTALMSSPPTLENGGSTRVLPTKTFATKAQDARVGGGARNCVLTTGTIESAGWSGRSVVDGSDGLMAGFWCSLLRILGGCAVDLTSQYAAVCAFFVRVAGYAGVVHGVGNVGQSAVIAWITFGLTA